MFFFLFRALNPFLIAAAVLPAIFLMVKIYKADTLEPEPPALLKKLAVAGILSTFLAMALEWVGGKLLLLTNLNDLLYDVLFYFVVVGLAEEFSKYYFLKKNSWDSDHFNCQFDAVVYSVFVGLGFALAENISYVLQYGFGTAVIRAVTAIPGHACFAVFMGAFYGAAKRYEISGYPDKSRSARLLSILVPTLLHGTYDFIATRLETGYAAVFAVFVCIMFIAALKLVKKLAKADEYMRY